MMDATTLVRAKWVLTQDDSLGDIENGAVLIGESGTIKQVGSWDTLRDQHPNANVIGNGGGILIPGFVNGHTHLTEGLIAGIGKELTLFEWFKEVVFPVERVITREDVRVGALLKGCEMLLSGITTVSDMSPHRNPGSLASLGAAEGLNNLGLRAVVCFGADNSFESAPDIPDLLEEHLKLAELVENSTLLMFRLGIATILNLSPEAIRASINLCKKYGWGIHTHLAETRDEIVECRRRHGRSSIMFAKELGMFELDVLAAHCVWCTDHELSCLADHDVSIAHNPVANMILASGVCRWPEYLELGGRVCLGTDGAASNDSQNMFEVLKMASLLQKVNELRADVADARLIVRLATIEGARALGIDDKVGSLSIGKRADMVLIDTQQWPELAVLHDPYSQLVYCAGPRNVSYVWVDGKLKVSAGNIVDIDLASLYQEANERAAKLLARAGLERSSVLSAKV